MSVGWLGSALTSQYYRDYYRDKMRTVLSHSSPDYRCDGSDKEGCLAGIIRRLSCRYNEPGCSYSGIKIIKKRGFTPDRPDESTDSDCDESDKRDDISTHST